MPLSSAKAVLVTCRGSTALVFGLASLLMLAFSHFIVAAYAALYFLGTASQTRSPFPLSLCHVFLHGQKPKDQHGTSAACAVGQSRDSARQYLIPILAR
jgi:hypothetical protein